MEIPDPSHAFYIGYELMKAKTALTLSKSYRQDQALEWGFLTEPEISHRARQQERLSRTEQGEGAGRRKPGNTRIQSQTRRPRDSRRDRDNIEPRERAQHRSDGAGRRLALSMAQFVLRPYRTATTYHNLKARGEGVFHVTDDVLLLAQTAIGSAPSPPPATRAADVVAGQILLDACRYYEFRVVELDDHEERTTIVVETAAQGRLRDFFGFNRAKHAVVEAAILATRTSWLPLAEMLDDFRKLAILIDKTGGPRERAAFTLLQRHVREAASARTRLEPKWVAVMTSRRVRIRVRTPSRLHFGLLAWGAAATRQFGGIGLMIDSPGIELSAEFSPSWTVTGPLSSRVERVIFELRRQMSEFGTSLPACRIEIDRVPAEHIGLGVGTQLSLAVAGAVLSLAGEKEATVEQLARLTGRGGRSGIGLHGFNHGGMIVDGGRRREGDIPPLLARVEFPEDWSILIVQPSGERGLHGPEEKLRVREFAPNRRKRHGLALSHRAA